MSLINKKELRQLVELNGGAAKTVEHLKEALKKGDLKTQDFSIRGLYETLVIDKATGKSCGHDVLNELDQGTFNENTANAVALGNFTNITTQLFFNAINEGFALEGFNVAPMFGVIQSNVISQGERVPGISNIGDAGRVIGENQEIPMAAVIEDYLDCPRQNKNAFRIPVTREALLADRTGILLEHCRNVGQMMGIAREKEACDVIINANGATARLPLSAGSTPYNWKGTNYAVWQTSATNSPFYDNTTASNALVDAQSINAAWLTLTQITDPYTGEPLADSGRYTLLCTPENKYTAMRILHGLQYRTVGGTTATTNMAPMLVSDGKSVVGDFEIVTSKYLANRLTNASQATTNWYFGDFGRAFKWMRALDITVEEALPNSGQAFTHDIPMQFRVMKFETASVHQPRVVTKNTVS